MPLESITIVTNNTSLETAETIVPFLQDQLSGFLLNVLIITTAPIIIFIAGRCRLLINSKHNHKNLEILLKKYLGDIKLGASLKDILLISYDVHHRAPALFSRKNSRLDPKNNLLMRDVARATSAAPTFFDSFVIKEQIHVESIVHFRNFFGTKTNEYIDGGIIVNNPSLCALLDVMPNKNKDDIFLLSLGTGLHSKRNKKFISNHGLLRWIFSQNLINEMIRGSSDLVDIQVKTILGGNYKRLQPELPNDVFLDDASKETIEKLSEIAEEYIKKNSDLIDQICTKLLEYGDEKEIKNQPEKEKVCSPNTLKM